MAQPTTTGDRPMPTIKTQPEFFVTFTSAEGASHEWTPKEINMRGLFTMPKVRKAAMFHAADLLDAGHGRIDWSFVIHEADYGLTSDPSLYKYGVQEYGFTRGKEVFRFD
jgi:hypothetical protein